MGFWKFPPYIAVDKNLNYFVWMCKLARNLQIFNAVMLFIDTRRPS